MLLTLFSQLGINCLNYLPSLMRHRCQQQRLTQLRICCLNWLEQEQTLQKQQWWLQGLRIFWSICVSEKTTTTKKSLPRMKTTSAQRQMRMTRQRRLVHNKYQMFPVLEVTPEEFMKNLCCPRRQQSSKATILQQDTARRLPLIVAASSQTPLPTTCMSCSPINNNIHII